jgi:hypothetical protein
VTDATRWVACRVHVPFGRLGRGEIRLFNIHDPYVQKKLRDQWLVPIDADQQPTRDTEEDTP